jgi:hypothetical protein
MLFGISPFPSQLESGVLPIMPLVVSFSWSLAILAFNSILYSAHAPIMYVLLFPLSFDGLRAVSPW